MVKAAPQREKVPMLATPHFNRLPATERGITLGDFLLPIRVGERMSARLRHIALICLGAVVVALTANIAIAAPGTPVPVTGQTLSVLVVGGALGLRRGALSIGLYLLLGMFLPIYAHQEHGLTTIIGINSSGLVLGAVGGYLVSFLFAGALVGWLAENGWDRHIGGAVGAMVLGEIVIYAIAVPWLAIALHVDLAKAVALGLTPFIIGDAIKLAIAAGIFPFAWWLVGRRTRSWGYAERDDDLLVTSGILFRRLVIVPYGRMQLVDLKAGPIHRVLGIATVQLHTAAATTDASIPGLVPEVAADLRDRLARRGEQRSAGL